MFINKFFTPTEMNSEQFFERWKKLSQPSQEAQKIFPAQFDIDVGQIRTKVTLIAFDPQTNIQLDGLGANVLDNVDPNPDNFVCAGIIETKSAAIGTLIRLEPNRQAKMFRLTVRSSHDTVAKGLAELLSKQF